MNNLIKACRQALSHNLGVIPGEKLLVLTDTEKKLIGEAFATAARALTKNVELIELANHDFQGGEPHAGISDIMLHADVIMIPMARSLSWTRARAQATDRGSRVASMPGITAEIILETFFQDYEAVKTRVNQICDLLDQTETIRVRAEAGTDITFNIRQRRGRGRKGGIYTEKGDWGNLPCGEAFIAPVERTAQGMYVIDASISRMGKVKEPIQVQVKAGKAYSLSGSRQASELENILKRTCCPEAFAIAEFGIGCNPSARLCGIPLVDEKALGTCHIAMGTNIYFGGTIEAGIHIDGIIRQPSITFDDRTIMQRGEFTLLSP